MIKSMREQDEILEKLDYIRKVTESNNKMLKSIVDYINYINAKASQENIDDFGRNVIANLVSNKIFKF